VRVFLCKIVSEMSVRSCLLFESSAISVFEHGYFFAMLKGIFVCIGVFLLSDNDRLSSVPFFIYF